MQGDVPYIPELLRLYKRMKERITSKCYTVSIVLLLLSSYQRRVLRLLTCIFRLLRLPTYQILFAKKNQHGSGFY